MLNGGSDISVLELDLAERSYDIVVGDGLIDGAGERIAPFLSHPSVVVITDENVEKQWLKPFEHSLSKAGIAFRSIVLPTGESTKCFSQFERLVENLLVGGVDRKTCLIALGGGVIGDITGFAAAVTLRGLDFIQVPTTLLAQVDSSVGGKTGINTAHGKNLVGAFYQPRLVLADTQTLDTLPKRELLAGYAEVVKYGLIDDAPFFEWCETDGRRLIDGDAQARRYAVHHCCAAKARIVAEDERETGVRALLNLGHTFGHALEAETGYGDRLLHGEAVAIGTLMAFDLSHRMELCSGQDTGRVAAHFEAAGLKTGLKGIADGKWSPERLVGHMSKDKKVEAGTIAFILTRGIGQAFITRDVDLEEVKKVLADALDI